MTTWFLIAVTAVLSALLLWGLVAPRSQWRVLIGWSTADPDAAEPGDGIHGIRRTICAIGLIGVLSVAGVQGWRMFEARPAATPEPTALQLMWGSPTPRLVDRLVAPVDAPPDGLVEGAVAGVQPLTKGSTPAYLVSLSQFDLLGVADPPGLIGHAPADGYTGYGQADLIIEASGPLDCIPRAVVALPGDSVLKLGVYWGPPGDAPAAGACDMAAPVLQRVLIPVQLPSPLSGRTVVTQDGIAIPIVNVRNG